MVLYQLSYFAFYRESRTRTRNRPIHSRSNSTLRHLQFLPGQIVKRKAGHSHAGVEPDSCYTIPPLNWREVFRFYGT